MSAGRTGALSILLVLAIPALARAQSQRLEVAGFVGSMALNQELGTSSNIYMTVTGAAANSRFGDLFGLRASWALTRNLAVAFDFSRGTNPYGLDVDDSKIGNVALARQFEAERLYYGGSVVAQFPTASGLVPYAVFGAGQLESKPRSPIAGIDKVSSIDWSFGAGVKYWIPPVPRLGVTFDVRYHTAKEGVAFPTGGTGPEGAELTVGATVRVF